MPALYKYFSDDRLDVLENGLIKFTRPNDFNDPFELPLIVDGLFDSENQLRDILNNKIYNDTNFLSDIHREILNNYNISDRLVGVLMREHKMVAEKIYENIKRSLADIGVLCLTTKCDNLLMWSHYANSHKGFVVEFDGCHEFFNRRRSDDDEFGWVRKVMYVDERPKCSFMNLNFEEFILTKGRCWEYEDEHRMSMPIYARDVVVNGSNLFRYPRECIRSVVAGARCGDEVLGRLRKYCDGNRTDFFRAVLSDSAYALSFVKI